MNIFGVDAVGSSVQDRAAASSVKFVRSQDELGLWSSSATGRVFTAKEALALFGAERLIEVWNEGSAVLPPNPSEPAKTLRERREALGLTQTDLSKFLKMDLVTIANAESPDFTSGIHDLTRIAISLGLEDAVLGFQPGASGDNSLAVRLKERKRDGAKPNTIAKLSSITWIIATQNRLQRLLAPNSNPMAGFVKSDYYGNSSNPVWDVASELALETRKLLGFSETEPISSLRNLCHRLQIPLIHASLHSSIAGCTLSTGSARGVVVNVNGNDGNVWVQRATVAHELGHLLWDPDERLKSLVVDNLDQIEKIVQESAPKDWVEARANAFAVELLAPKRAIREFISYLDTNDSFAISEAIRNCMVHFGLSATAMRYHLWNAFDRSFDVDNVRSIDPTPTDDWKGREQFTDDFFVLPDTSLERRGEFAAVIVKSEREKWISEETAAFYLETNVHSYQAKSNEILSLF